LCNRPRPGPARAERQGQWTSLSRLRDRAIFVGEPDDVVPDTFGPGLPPIRDWTTANFAFLAT
jgi:hypothetical protein